MNMYKTRFKWNNNISNRSELFNGKYITALSRIPNIGEHISISNHSTPYKIVDVITELNGWKESYTIVVE